MMDNDALIAQANALIKRRRSFIAAPRPAAVVAEAPLDFDLSESVHPAGEDDLPVLTEVVELSAPAAKEESSPSISPEEIEELKESLVSILAADLAHSIEQRLAIEVPSLIEATLASLQDDLQRGIVAATEAALKDFITRRRQLQSPEETSEPPLDH